ncbi:MAG: chemotaxis response regulator protein-glutamate methylesterase [Gammaproteobacteria bacterium]|nr:chemotaxis response regulator protein-glutamate methylesterase [Gammaproteobacteria bacterium]
MKKTKVLIVDDSALIRLLLSEILSNDNEIEVVGVASDPFEAREKIKRTSPDVITLDIEMPKMDGLTFLKNLMRLRPMPVVMISTLTQKGADVTLQALELGAFDFVCKPSKDVKENLSEYGEEICRKVKAAAESRPQERVSSTVGKVDLPRKIEMSSIDIIAIGASTGGTEAIKEVITRLPLGMPPIVIAQHIPDVFSTSYAKRLNSLTELTVSELRESQILKSNNVYIAPGDDHLYIKSVGQELVGKIKKTEPINRHRPSVDVLFESVAREVGRKAIGILLTGMGSDGARGLLMMKQAGALTFAQDRESSVVWGMPGKAVAIDAVNKVLPLNKIASTLVRSVSLS